MAILTILAAPVQAQSICAERTGVLKQLNATHKETPRAVGLTGSGKVVELLTSDTGSWTLIATRPSGVSCLIAAGEGWETIERLAEGPGA